MNTKKTPDEKDEDNLKETARVAKSEKHSLLTSESLNNIKNEIETID